MKKSYFIRWRYGDNEESESNAVIDVTFPVTTDSDLSAKEKLKIIVEVLADEIGEEAERIFDGKIVILVLSAI
jgi:predicted RNA-binding protein with PUA domain